MIMELYHKSKNKLNINKVIRVYIQNKTLENSFDEKHIFFVFIVNMIRVCLRVCKISSKIKSNC